MSQKPLSPSGPLQRRRFMVLGAQGAVAAGVLWACSGYGDSGTGSENGGSGDCTIANNHGHTCPDVDVNAATVQNLAIGGSHTHSVTLSVQQLADLKAGKSVTVESGTTNGHNHSVTFTA